MKLQIFFKFKHFIDISRMYFDKSANSPKVTQPFRAQ